MIFKIILLILILLVFLYITLGKDETIKVLQNLIKDPSKAKHQLMPYFSKLENVKITKTQLIFIVAILFIIILLGSE